mgnify:FL=1
MIPVDNLSVEGRFLVFLSKLGTMKRTSLSEFSNARANGIKAAGVKGGDVILDVAMSDGTAELMLLSRSGRAIRFPEEQISIVGRTAAGVKGMSLKDDEVIGMLLIRRDSTVLTVSEDGLGKRTPIDDFPLQNRGGMGNLFTPTSGDVSPIVCALEVMEADEVMIITAGGQVTRAAADSVPVQGRRTQGKSMVAIPEGDRVVEVTRASGRGGAPARDDVGEEENEGQLDLLG